MEPKPICSTKQNDRVCGFFPQCFLMPRHPFLGDIKEAVMKTKQKLVKPQPLFSVLLTEHKVEL